MWRESQQTDALANEGVLDAHVEEASLEGLPLDAVLCGARLLEDGNQPIHLFLGDWRGRKERSLKKKERE